MTTEEFKNANPKLSHLEGDELYDAMTNYILRQQSGEKIIKQIKPFWKKYQLRWLFYKAPKNWSMAKNNYSSNNICKECKKGVSTHMMFIFTDKNGDTHHHSNCPHCNKSLIKIPNNNLNHKLWLFKEKTIKIFWLSLDKIHLVRTKEQRYGMFGDEFMYVNSWTFDDISSKMTCNMKTRKWWEYIFIEK